MISGTPSEPERLKYLDLIQGVITRQAGNAFLIKGWSLTVSAAFFGYVSTHLSWEAALTSLVPVVGFFYLEAFYLRQERLFRALWADVVGTAAVVQLFSLDTRAYVGAEKCQWRRVLFRSWHLTVFYGVLLVVGLALFARALQD